MRLTTSKTSPRGGEHTREGMVGSLGGAATFKEKKVCTRFPGPIKAKLQGHSRLKMWI